MDEWDRDLLRKTVEETMDSHILITHGSDTMIQSAQALLWIDGKTIVFTGSRVPHVFKSSDAEFNVGFALGWLLSLSHGVYLAIWGEFFHPDNVVKNESGIFTKLH